MHKAPESAAALILGCRAPVNTLRGALRIVDHEEGTMKRAPGSPAHDHARHCICAVAGAIVLLAVSVDASARTITVVSATFGQNCGAQQGNATHDVARQCNGSMSCQYVLNDTLAHENANRCGQDFRAEWRCNEREFHTAILSPAARPGDTLVLNCAWETGAGK